MYHIQVVGAGYAGSRIAAHFREKKQKVWALTRSGKRNAEFEALGILPVIADLAKPATLERIPPAHFIVICPAPGEKKDEAAYRQIYLEGIGNYLAAIGKNPKPNLIVYLSSTGVYSDRKGEWVDETTPPEPDTEKGKILLEAEQQVLNSGYPAIVFRLAGIYGPERNRLIRPFISQDEASDRWLNHIHVEDIAGAMPVIFNKGQAGSLYLGVDDEPVLQSEFARWLANKNVILRPKAEESREILRQKTPQDDRRRADYDKDLSAIKGKRCSNKRLKELGYQFKYPTYKEGYEAILKETRHP
ncbi:MAG TPA: SDR family oxidoreductase, partial [bacterium]|nr:SDR family oxidoreductase [bacterium]